MTQNYDAEVFRYRIDALERALKASEDMYYKAKEENARLLADKYRLMRECNELKERVAVLEERVAIVSADLKAQEESSDDDKR